MTGYRRTCHQCGHEWNFIYVDDDEDLRRRQTGESGRASS